MNEALINHIPTSAEIWTPPPVELPSTIFLGTSTWAFPGWRGVVYRNHYASQKAFTQESLAEYATIPWFRTVCIDNLFYTPPRQETLTRYASQTPNDFRWVSKVWERITIHHYPKHPRYGAYAGTLNPDFLNYALFRDSVLAPYEHEEIATRTGPFILQFAPFSERDMEYDRFIDRLGKFLSLLPHHFEYAVEVRNGKILSRAYFDALNASRVTHCFNQWNNMIPLREQMRLAASAGGLSAPFFTARLLTPTRVSYEAAEKLFEPYDRIQRVNPEMRSDVAILAKRANTTGKRLYVTANNKAEGNSALTMVAIAKIVAGIETQLPG